MAAPVRALTMLLANRAGASGQTRERSSKERWPDRVRKSLRQARKRPVASTDPSAAILHAFGLDGEQPVAAWQAAGALGKAQTEGCWMSADPIYLHPDRDHLLVFDASQLSIHAQEAQALVDSLNDLYRSDGWRFQAISASQWLVQVPTSYEFITPSLADIAGKSLVAYLPSGANGRFLVNRLNEIQMLFHGHPVNEKRLQQERPTISGVWLSGLACLPAESTLPRRFDRVLSNDALTRGIADWSDIAHETLPESLSGVLQGVTEGRTLIDCGSAEMDQCDSLLENAIADLWQRRFSTLCIYPGDGYVYHLQRSQRLKFWLRS